MKLLQRTMILMLFTVVGRSLFDGWEDVKYERYRRDALGLNNDVLARIAGGNREWISRIVQALSHATHFGSQERCVNGQHTNDAPKLTSHRGRRGWTAIDVAPLGYAGSWFHEKATEAWVVPEVNRIVPSVAEAAGQVHPTAAAGTSFFTNREDGFNALQRLRAAPNYTAVESVGSHPFNARRSLSLVTTILDDVNERTSDDKTLSSPTSNTQAAYRRHRSALRSTRLITDGVRVGNNGSARALNSLVAQCPGSASPASALAKVVAGCVSEAEQLSGSAGLANEEYESHSIPMRVLLVDHLRDVFHGAALRPRLPPCSSDDDGVPQPTNATRHSSVPPMYPTLKKHADRTGSHRGPYLLVAGCWKGRPHPSPIDNALISNGGAADVDSSIGQRVVSTVFFHRGLTGGPISPSDCPDYADGILAEASANIGNACCAFNDGCCRKSVLRPTACLTVAKAGVHSLSSSGTRTTVVGVLVGCNSGVHTVHLSAASPRRALPLSYNGIDPMPEELARPSPLISNGGAANVDSSIGQREVSAVFSRTERSLQFRREGQQPVAGSSLFDALQSDSSSLDHSFPTRVLIVGFNCPSMLTYAATVADAEQLIGDADLTEEEYELHCTLIQVLKVEYNNPFVGACQQVIEHAASVEIKRDWVLSGPALWSYYRILVDTINKDDSPASMSSQSVILSVSMEDRRLFALGLHNDVLARSAGCNRVWISRIVPALSHATHDGKLLDPDSTPLFLLIPNAPTRHHAMAPCLMLHFKGPLNVTVTTTADARDPGPLSRVASDGTVGNVGPYSLDAQIGSPTLLKYKRGREYGLSARAVDITSLSTRDNWFFVCSGGLRVRTSPAVCNAT
ncbi:hypothetical protein DIPPA_26393, partial [Diplonema papillatum]